MNGVTVLKSLAGVLLFVSVANCAQPAAAPAPRASAPAQPAAAPAQASAPAPAAASPAQQQLIDAARREGELLLVWSESTLNGTEGARRMGAQFNARYGLNTNVQFTPGPAMPEVANKLIQEMQAGRRATVDVYLGPDTSILAMVQAGALEPVDWKAWSSNVTDPRLITGNGEAVEIITSTIGFTYNSAKLSGAAVPRTTQDLLKPEYKGHLASTPYAAMFDAMASPEVWGEQRTKEYVTKFSDQISGLIRCGENDRILSGEFDLLAMDCGSYQAMFNQAKGLPLAQVVPTDASLLFHWFVGVPKNAAHPATAKLFIDWLVSREGQDAIWENQAADHHLIPGSKMAPIIEKYQADGAKFVEMNLGFLQRNNPQDVERLRSEFQAMLRKQQ